MNILYVSSVCSQKRFDWLVEQGFVSGQFQNQKFHHLLLRGLIEEKVDSISVVSFPPINRGKTNKIQNYEDVENGIQYFYPGYLNKPVLNHIAKFFKTYRFLKRFRKADSVVVCNIMNFDECFAALVFRMFHSVKVCAITADVPGITSGAGKNDGAWWKRMLISMALPFNIFLRSRYDAYKFLSQYMNKDVNTKCKPYIVVEGVSDLSMEGKENIASEKYPTKTIMYAGGLHKEYGIALLVEAFKKIPNQDVELHIYGKGNYENEIIKAASNDLRIKYLGTKPNSEIVEAQIKSHLLVNPRPTDADFVKYSFPSKIMECMASGTPLMTTCIPSMPEDYYPYVYLMEDETVEGFCKAICDVINLSADELHSKGNAAKSFILSEKNYKVQAHKLYSLLEMS